MNPLCRCPHADHGRYFCNSSSQLALDWWWRFVDIHEFIDEAGKERWDWVLKRGAPPCPGKPVVEQLSIFDAMGAKP